MIRGYEKYDPPTAPKLAVPVSVVAHLVTNALKKGSKTTNKQKHLAHLCNIAFYYLLRVSEYTKAYKNQEGKQTQPFRVGDITLRHKGKIIPPSSSLAQLLTADEGTLRIPNQKSGIKGQVIHHFCTGTQLSPIKSLAYIIHHIMNSGGNCHTCIGTYFDRPGNPKYVNSTDISRSLKAAAKAVGLFQAPFMYQPEDVSSHSLRAGGAMALHCNGCTSHTIQIQGRLRSQTFMMYIHEQISSFAQGLSLKMSRKVPFRKIASPFIGEDKNRPRRRT